MDSVHARWGMQQTCMANHCIQHNPYAFGNAVCPSLRSRWRLRSAAAAGASVWCSPCVRCQRPRLWSLACSCVWSHNGRVWCPCSLTLREQQQQPVWCASRYSWFRGRHLSALRLRRSRSPSVRVHRVWCYRISLWPSSTSVPFWAASSGSRRPVWRRFPWIWPAGWSGCSWHPQRAILEDRRKGRQLYNSRGCCVFWQLHHDHRHAGICQQERGGAEV